MFKSRTIVVLAMMSGLVSCQSFNHTTYIGVLPGKAKGFIDPENKPGPGIAESLMKSDDFLNDGPSDLPPDPKVPKEATLNVICPVYKLPELPQPPELPYDQLAKLSGTNDPDAFERMALDHIKALRAYITANRKVLRDSHQQYLRECASYVSGQH